MMHGQAFGGSFRILCCMIVSQRNKMRRSIEEALPIQIHDIHSVTDFVEESFTFTTSGCNDRRHITRSSTIAC